MQMVIHAYHSLDDCRLSVQPASRRAIISTGTPTHTGSFDQLGIPASILAIFAKFSV